MGAVTLVDGGQPVTERLTLRAAEGLELILLVGDAEPARDPGLLTVGAEQLDREGVDGAPGDCVGPGVECGGEPIGDLAGRAIGERDRQDGGWVEASLLDEIADPLDEAEGLPRPGSGQDEGRAAR